MPDQHLTGDVSCDFCGLAGVHLTEYVDGKTSLGPWAIMCTKDKAAGEKSCFAYNGVGLGTGLGQKYVRQPDGSYLKVGG